MNHAIFYEITSENLDTVVNNEALSIGYGVIDKGEEGIIAYISFNIQWIAIQLLIRPDNFTFWRVKYGGNTWTEWTRL